MARNMGIYGMSDASGAGDGGMTHSDFSEMFPSDAACLEYLKERFYPDGSACPGCRRRSRFHRIRGRKAYSCQYCGTHVHPAAGTVFEKSRLSLRMWFWSVFLISSTGGRISVPELERELGVAPKTARRMLAAMDGLLETGKQQEVSRQPTATRHPREPQLEPGPVRPDPLEPRPLEPAPGRTRRAWYAGRRRT